MINYALPDSNLLHDWYEAIDFDLYSPLKLDYTVIAELINKDSDNLSNLAGGKEINEERVNWLVSFIEYLVNKEELDLLNKYKVIPNQNDQLCLLKNLYSDSISHKLLNARLVDRLKQLSEDIGTDGDIRKRLIHEKIQSKLIGKIDFSELDLYKLCREVDDGIKSYKGNPRDQSFRAILKDMFAWKNESLFSDELIRDYFPYFGKEHSQLYLNTKSAEELTYAFEIDMSGKSEALARIAKTSLTTEQLNTIAKNSTKVLSFIEWISSRDQDNPNEELGEIGEQYLNKELIAIFGESRVFWDKAREYDFRILENDLSTVKYYIDAKTTMKGLGNTENVPFYMRTAQWKFLENRNAYGKYVIARLEKYNEDYRVKYLKISIEKVEY